MDTEKQFFENLGLSDFTAVSFQEWQLQQAKQKPFNVVKRLKRLKQVKKAPSISEPSKQTK